MAKVVRLNNEGAQLRAELDRLRKEYATFAIQANELAIQHGVGAPGVHDAAVGRLLQFFHHEIGKCMQCRREAPLENGVCAWGCSP